MRVIFNIHSHTAAASAGWRAKEFSFTGSEKILEEILKEIQFTDNETACDFIFDNDLVKSHFSLFVNGRMVINPKMLKDTIKDSTQIHLMEKR